MRHLLDRARQAISGIDLKTWIVVAMAVWLAVTQLNERRHDETKTQRLINALQDKQRDTTGKDGSRVSGISQIQTTPKVFLSVKSNDKQIQRLQSEVERYRSELRKGGSVTTITGEMHVDTTATDAGVATDGKWYAARIANGRAVIDVKSDITAALITRDGKPVLEVTERNPYFVHQVRTFSVDNDAMKAKRWGIGPYVGYDASSGVSAGVAASYHLINW